MSTQDYTAPFTASNRPAPQIRQRAQDDGQDHDRIKLVRERWHHQDISLLERDKQVEQQCRMLMGDQWSVWSPLAGMFVNIAEAMGLPEILWRELPRINLLADWYDYTIARLTENPPVLGAIPRDPDRLSAMLADASDIILPKLWDDMDMSRVVFEMVGWMATAGWTFVKTYADFSKTEPVDPQTGLADQDEAPSIMRLLNPGPQGVVNQPEQPDGALNVRVLGPLDARGEWGNSIPWQKKRWHIHRSIMLPRDVSERFGVEVKPDTTIQGASATQYYRLRLERGPGHYGATDLSGYGWGNSGVGPPEELVTVDEMWERPSRDFPQGRLLIVTGQQVLHDGPRPYPRLADYDYTSPITYVEWQRTPGRPYGTSPMERGVPIQRQVNLGARQILLHRAKMTNPVLLLDASQGLTEEDAESFGRPGSNVVYEGNPSNPRPPASFLQPAPLSGDTWKTQEWLEQMFYRVMDLEGAGGVPQTSDASGEQVKELRFNSDRPISVPVRHLATGLEEIGCLWYIILPLVWPEGKLVAYLGDDNAARSAVMGPELFDGKVRVQINAESMMPRSRQEREAAARANYQMMLYGQPGTPEAIAKFFKQARFPDTEDTDLPGGVDVVTMKHLINAITQGTPAKAVPMIEQWNYPAMLATLREHMAAPEFLSYQPPVQTELQQLWLRMQDGQNIQMMIQAQRQARAQGMAMQIAAPVAMAHAALSKGVTEQATPTPPPEPQQSSSSS